MVFSKKRITVKVFLSYVLLALLTMIVSSVILSEIKKLTAIEIGRVDDKNKIVNIGKILTLMYETESLGRLAIQSDEENYFEDYVAKNTILQQEIDTLQSITLVNNQKMLLDSVKQLIQVKVINIKDLREIKKNDVSESSLGDAIDVISSLESYLGKLTIKDFTENPEKLSKKERENLQEYVDIMNRYSNNSTPTAADQAKMDSIVSASKSILNKIRFDASKQNKLLKEKEQLLMENDVLVSQQLRKILSTLEDDIISASRKLNIERSKALARSRETLTIAAIVGVFIIIVFTLIILSDFWKTQRYREQIEAANVYTNTLLKSREQLISMVSHDMRTPLSTISGYTQLLSKANLNTKEKYYVDHIQNASGYVNQLVDDLLDYSKLEANRVTIEKVPFNLFQLAKDTAYSVQSIYKNKAITLQVEDHIPCTHKYVGDPNRVKQILYNLIGNAYKFTEKGAITVRISSKENAISIAVIDTGIGISREKQQQIFEEFVQEDQQTGEKYGGFGLGLHISKKLSALLGGSLEVASTKNQGSTFTLVLPKQFSNDVIENQQLATKDDTETVQIKGVTAVLIDDDDTLLKLHQNFLEQFGITVLPFESAKSALDSLGNLQCDLIITDIQLPKMNGFHFLEEVRNNKLIADDIPVVAVTGRKDLGEKYYHEAGFAEVLFKPFTAEQLSAVLQTFFNDIATTFANQNVIVDTTSSINIEPLAGFLNHDAEALKEVLEIYIEDTQKSVVELNKAAEHFVLKDVQALAHKMLSMFKQIEAKKEVIILTELQNNEQISAEELSLLVGQFNASVTQTMQEIKQYYASIP